MPLKVATALLVIAIAVLVWHQWGAQPVAELRAAQTVAAVHPHDLQIPIASRPLTGNLETATAHVGTAAPAVQRSTAPPTGSATPSTTAPLKSAHPDGVDGGPASLPGWLVPQANTGADASPPLQLLPQYLKPAADRPRVQISGRPRKLVYPVCPETRARGKVSLQAVVEYDGAVSRVRVLTGDRILAAAAIEAVRQWRYEPFSGAAPHLERETNITISFISNEVVAVSFPTSAPLSRCQQPAYPVLSHTSHTWQLLCISPGSKPATRLLLTLNPFCSNTCSHSVTVLNSKGIFISGRPWAIALAKKSISASTCCCTSSVIATKLRSKGCVARLSVKSFNPVRQPVSVFFDQRVAGDLSQPRITRGKSSGSM